MPTQLNITVLTDAGGASGGTTTATVVAVPIPAALQTLDSGNTNGGGQASQQTGFSSVDIATRNIYKAGAFFASGTWYGVDQIQEITAQ
jgi:hypothetical protein